MTTQNGILNEIDLNKISHLIDLRFDLKFDEAKKELATKADLKNLVTKAQVEAIIEYKLEEKLEQKFNEKLGNLPTKDEFITQMSKLLTAINGKEDDDKVHKQLHATLGKDTAVLKQRVKHLYDTFEIALPASPAFS
jgi:hypothetical protein